MSKTFFISDLHLGHAAIIKHCSRPFSSVKEMDEHIIERWNNTVSNGDKVYVLGDIFFGHWRDMVTIFSYLNGSKVLIKGNHDNEKLSHYSMVFKDVRATHLLGTGQQNLASHLLLSHVPIHPSSVRELWVNVHGHLHDRPSPQGNYLNVSVEQIDYTPIEFNQLVRRCNKIIEK